MSEKTDNKPSNVSASSVAIVKLSPDEAKEILHKMGYDPQFLDKDLGELGASLSQKEKMIRSRAFKLAVDAIIGSEDTITEKTISYINLEEDMTMTMRNAVSTLTAIFKKESDAIMAEILNVINSTDAPQEKERKILELGQKLEEIHYTIYLAILYSAKFLMRMVVINLPPSIRPPLINSNVGYDILGSSEHTKKRGLFS